MIEIKHRDGGKCESVEANVGSKRKFTLMKEDYVTLKFSTKEPVQLKLGDFVELPDDTTGIFELVDIQKPTYNNATCGYDYELRLDAYYWKWKNKVFMFVYEKTVGGKTEYIRKETSWSLTATLETHLNALLKNLVALDYKYKDEHFSIDIDSTVEQSAKLITYDNMNLIDALNKMAETWECEWWITNKSIHFGRCEYNDPVDFEFGVNVAEMSRQDSQSVFATRVYAFGSTRNLPTDYRPADEAVVVDGVVQRRLMLPADTPYMDAYEGMSAEEVVEDVVVFDDVYPHRIGTITDVVTHVYIDETEGNGEKPVYKKWNAFRFKDGGKYNPEDKKTDTANKLVFSKDYRLPGQELHIIFQSGALNGMDFTVIFNPCDKEGGETPVPDRLPNGSCNPQAQVFEIVRNDNFGRELPGDTLVPKEGDIYVLYGYDTKFVSVGLMGDAENELKQKAQKYIEKTRQDPSVYTCKMNSTYIYNGGKLKSFEVGARVNLIHPAYIEQGRISRIIGFEYNLDLPYDSPVYTIGETASYSRLGELEGKLDSLTYKGQTYTGSGGSGVYLITSSDKTKPGDRNAYSAKRALSEFINKKQDDEADGLITFLKGLTSEGLAQFNNGLLVKSGSARNQLLGALIEQNDGGDGLVANIIEESDDDSQPLSVALIEVPASDGATTLGGLRNVDDTADTFSDTDDILVRKAGTKEWAVERLIRSGWIPVNTTSERDALDTSYLLKGCVCYVFNEDALYKWTGTAWEKKELGGGGSTGIQRNVRITNNLDSKNISASKGEPCLLKFTFVSQERYDSGEAYEDTGERGVCLISVKSSNSDEYAVVKQLPVNSAVPTTIDVAEFLTSGVNNVMIKVTGTVTEVTTPAFVYTVQLTSLSVDAGNFKWWTAYTGNVTLPLYIGGNVSKTLYVNISGTDYNESYEVALGTSVYVETAYNYAIPHPGKTGVFRISAYVSNSDGSIKTKTVSFNVICAVPGEQVKLVAVNNALVKAINWSENTLFEYAMYDGDNVTTSAQFVVKQDSMSVFTSTEDNIACSTKHTFSFPMEIETMDNTDFEIVTHILDGEMELVSPISFSVNNSLGYSAVAGSVFYMNPKTRSNRQENYKSIINEVDGSCITGVWKNLNWGNDGWMTDVDGNKTLRLLAGSMLTMDYKPFEVECARKGKTIEVDYRIDNVTDYTEPVITISSASGDSFVGLNIYADEIIMHSQSLKNEDIQSLHTFEGKRTRLALTILPDAYGNSGFNLCILYVNGVKNREFTYESNDYFAHSGGIVIGSEYADVDIYGIRVYDSGLTSQGVMTNYINWLSDINEKTAAKANNDIFDSNGSEIDFENTKDQFNVIVYDNTIPSMADQTSRVGTLEVFFYDHPDWNVSISNVTAKGQGTSSMKYWIWNTRYQLDKVNSVVTHADGTTSAKKWQMTPFLPAGQKFTAKKNFASSMHSHKIGSVNSYEDLYREVGLLNEAMKTEKYANARVAVYQIPFVCFEKQVNDEGETIYIFRGLYTFGPDKGDKYTFGFDTDLFPDLLSIEGSDNSPLCTLFRVPWNNNVFYNEDKEAWQYNGANSWNFGEGELDKISKFIPAYNMVYQCSPRLKPFNGTLDELNAQVITYRNEPCEFWIAKEGDVNLYNVYYFESSQNKFIPSDIGNGTINLVSQLVDKGYGLGIADLENKTGDELNMLFVNARIAKFRKEAPQYWDVEDTLFFMNNVEFNAGTDERAKNTYPYCFGTEISKWRWRVDDADTRFDTTNRGLPDKEYSVETHDVDKTGASIWNGETNNFFNLMELAFPDEKITSMRKMMTAMQTLGGLKSGNDLEKIYAFYQKYFFDNAQEYFPQNAYNADAKYCYENGKLAYNAGKYSNDTDPITQSLGDHYLAEQRWITKRILYMMSKYSFGTFSAGGTDTITVRAAGNTIKYELTPAMDMYPAIANGTSIIRGTRTKSGDVCEMEIELSGSGDQQNAIQGASYLQDIGDWHNKNVQGSMIIQGQMLRDIRLGSKTEPIVISISSLTISNCVSLQRLLLSNISTLAGTLNLAACTHLQEVHADGTSLVQVILPAGGGLRTVEFSAYNQYLTLANYPLMTNEGVGIDLCKGIITDFFVVDCPRIDPMRLLVDIMNTQDDQGGAHALKRIRAVGFDENYESSEMLDKLVQLADGSYSGLSSEGLSGEDDYPVLDGTLNINANCYEDSIEALRNTFKKLVLNITGEYFIRFTDPLLAQMMISRYDTDKDGGISASDANQITQIPSEFLKGNQEIKSLKGFEKLTNCTLYGNIAFEGSSLEDAYFPPNLVTIRNRCFYKSKIKKANLPDSVTYLETGGGNMYMPFYDCFDLEEFTMKDFIYHATANKGFVMNGGFSDCTNLKRFKMNSFTLTADNPASSSDWPLLSFSACVSLEECDFGEIKGIVNALPQNMFNLTPISASLVPPNIILTNYRAYGNCSNLKVVVFEGNITKIGQTMFENCNNVTVIFKSMIPPTTINYGGLWCVGAIYVPDEAVDVYKSGVMSGSASIIYPLSTYTGYMPTKLYEVNN